jgi:hypothetical protein
VGILVGAAGELVDTGVAVGIVGIGVASDIVGAVGMAVASSCTGLSLLAALQDISSPAKINIRM